MYIYIVNYRKYYLSEMQQYTSTDRQTEMLITVKPHNLTYTTGLFK